MNHYKNIQNYFKYSKKINNQNQDIDQYWTKEKKNIWKFVHVQGFLCHVSFIFGFSPLFQIRGSLQRTNKSNWFLSLAVSFPLTAKLEPSGNQSQLKMKHRVLRPQSSVSFINSTSVPHLANPINICHIKNAVCQAPNPVNALVPRATHTIPSRTQLAIEK